MFIRFAMPIRFAAAAAWTTAAINILPDGWLFDLDGDQALFVIAVACVLTYAVIAQAHAAPVIETYKAGKAEGRRLALLELSCEKVAPLPAARPRLQVVPDVERRAGSDD